MSRSGSRRRNWQSQTTSRKSESQPQLAQRTRCPTWSSWEDGCGKPVSVVMSRGQVKCSAAVCQRPRSQGHTDGNMYRPSKKKKRSGNPVIKKMPRGENWRDQRKRTKERGMASSGRAGTTTDGDGDGDGACLKPARSPGPSVLPCLQVPCVSL